jgi:hypothetical protein
MQSVDLCRPLGAGEQRLWLHDQAHPLHFVLTAQIKGRFTVDQLQQALSQVQRQHPLLRVCIALDESGHPWFIEHSTKIPLRVVQRQSEQDWQREVEQEIAAPFVWSQAPLVRVVLVQSRYSLEMSELIVTCHHSIADGISATYLIRDILQAIATPTACEKPLAIPPSREDLVLGKFPEMTLTAKSIPKFSSNSLPVMQHVSKSNRFSVSSGSLLPEITQLLIARCREEHTTVHAVICTAFLLAIRHQSPLEEIQSISCFSPINLRPYLKSLTHNDVCSYLAAERTSHLLGFDSNLWDVARSVKSQLNQTMTFDILFEKISQNQAWISTNPSPHDTLQVFEDQFKYDIAVSNLMRLPIEQEFGALELEAIYGTVVTTGVENDRLVGIATLRDRLFFTLVCSEEVMLRAESKLLHEKAIQLLSVAIAA